MKTRFTGIEICSIIVFQSSDNSTKRKLGMNYYLGFVCCMLHINFPNRTVKKVYHKWELGAQQAHVVSLIIVRFLGGPLPYFGEH